MRYDRNGFSGILPKAPGKAVGGGDLQPEGMALHHDRSVEDNHHDCPQAGRYNKYVITCFCLPIHTFHQELVLKIYHVQSGYIRLLAEFVDILYGEQADPLPILLK